MLRVKVLRVFLIEVELFLFLPELSFDPVVSLLVLSIVLKGFTNSWLILIVDLRQLAEGVFVGHLEFGFFGWSPFLHESGLRVADQLGLQFRLLRCQRIFGLTSWNFILEKLWSDSWLPLSHHVDYLTVVLSLDKLLMLLFSVDLVLIPDFILLKFDSLMHALSRVIAMDPGLRRVILVVKF